MAKRQVTLTWDGKAEALDALRHPAPPIELEEVLGPRASSDASPPNSVHRVIRGDALDVARALASEGLQRQIDLVYLDPPYASGVDYTHEERLDGHASGRVARATAYGDRWSDGTASYLDMLLPRLTALQPLLKPSGSIWIQVDWRASYLVRAICDEIFGRARFMNEIVWRRAPNLGRQARSGQFGRTLDTLIVYGASQLARLVPPERLAAVDKRTAKLDSSSGRWFTLAPRGDYTDESIARLEKEGRVYRSSRGGVSIKYWLEEDAGGTLYRRQPVDALWIDIPPLRHAAQEERTGYPTQKPRALLERVILASCPASGLVVDLFAGSGTTAAAAARLGRSFIVGDSSPVAVATMRSRLLREGAQSLAVESCGGRRETARARIELRGCGKERMEVSLSWSAGAEPIAWALSLDRSKHGPFKTDWHAERGTGRRPTELATTALLPRSPFVRARVYFVDGRVALAETSFTAGRAELTSVFEAPT